MKTPRSTYSLLIAALFLFALLSCQGGPPKSGDEKPDREPAENAAMDRFDPLNLPRDREVMPLEQPRQGTIGEATVFVASDSVSLDDTLALQPIDFDVTYDTLSSQAFRVQLLTTKVYGEARRAHEVAEEIFDQPVFTDYEVPYYKVRVGSFTDRDQAEEYQQRARAAGYREAWVVLVLVGVRETAPLYPQPEVDSVLTDESVDSSAVIEGEDER